MHRRTVHRLDQYGQGTLEYVAGAVVVAVVLGAIWAMSPTMPQRVSCAVQRAVDMVTDHPQTACAPGEAGAPTGGPGGGGAPGGGPGVEPVDCEDVTYVHDPVTAGHDVARVGCRWYPLPPECLQLPGVAGLEPGRTPASGVDTKPFADCVTAGHGDPQDDPDADACERTQPADAKPTGDDTVVQVGCTTWVVPQPCRAQWEAYGGAPDGSAEQAQAGWRLGDCVTTWYDEAEVPCVVKSSTTTERTEATFLFFIKIRDDEGLLVEQLGDGRWRVHALEDVRLGGGVQQPDGTKGAEFELMGLTGWGSDETFEFADEASAQSWVDWYKDYRDKRDDLRDQQRRLSTPYCMGTGRCIGSRDVPKRYQEAVADEPHRHRIADASSRSTTVKISGGWAPTGSGAGVNGSYQGEAVREVRHNTDGTTTTNLSMTNEGGVALLGKLGRPSKGGKPPKDADEGKAGTTKLDGALKDSLGTEVSGKTTVTVVWGADGKPQRIVLAVDDQMLGTLAKANPEVDVKLPLGFSAHGEYSYTKQQGTSTVRENIIDLSKDPALQEQVAGLAGELFPRDDDGGFSDAAPRLDFDTDGLGDLTEDRGVTRNLEYDVDKTASIGGGGLNFAGLPIVEVKSGKLTEGRGLTGSSLDLTDVNGQERTQTPSPRCRDKQVDPATYPYDGGGPPYPDREDDLTR